MPSSSKNMDFKCALVTGGGGGIGKALSHYFVSQGKKVIIAGRTESNLKSTAKEIGAAGYYVLDTGRISDIPSFISKITKEHPELDCLVNNAGVQRPLEVLKQDPEEILEKADQEIDINIRGPMHLVLGLLKHFKAKEHALIINVSSVLGFVPFSVINPVYNGTKAWVHFWTVTLRTQLKDTNVRIVEIAPPAVGTDLHREREDPDDNKKDKNPNSLTIEEFMDEVSKKLENGDDMISAGMGNGVVGQWYETMGAKYSEMTSK
ncbi:putative Short-chain dehydrogenases/reductase [Seiridium unicorne]|uniref:Short-chain dehydrogenases/reductase n=1 Tax=Seiridium unicorne TaxID=138068 RepID=A0ABR2V8H9_9PEZI